MTGRGVMTVRKDGSKVRKTIGILVSKVFALSVTASLPVILLAAVPARASDVSYSFVEEGDNYLLYENDYTGYQILIDDAADIFSPEEEEELIPYMAESSDGGFVLLITTDHNEYGNAESYAGNYYRSQIPDESGVLFLIDLDTRKLLFYSEGEYKRELTSSKMNIIGDNIYKYATNGDFYTCAREAFTQVSDVLEGRRISARMKYISNACLAILLALIINYFIARAVSRAAKPSDESIVDSLYSQFSFTDPKVTFLHETRKYSPRSSGSGGSGGGGGGHSSGGHGF